MPASDVPVLLVDGHNVIHAWKDLCDLHRQRPAQARTELCRILTAYQDISHTRVIVAFDSGGSRSQAEEHVSAIQVFYASADASADAIIERLATRYAGQYAITAATDDLAVQHAVAAAGGCWISTAALRDQLERATGEFRRKWDL